MFPHRLRPFLRLVMALSLTLAPAAFAADVTDVVFTVEIRDVGGSAPDITVEVRVQGTDLANGTITLPSAPGIPIPLLEEEGTGDLVRNLVVVNEMELAQFFGAGNYALSLNGGTVTATIVYDPRPSVPAPNIQFPTDDDRIVPGAVEVLFTACGFQCSAPGSVSGVLEDDAETVLADDALLTSDTTWTPSHVLEENSAFVARVSHTAEASKPVDTINDDEDGGFFFTAVFTRSDSVAFETGFAPPLGDFCIEANAPVPDADCAQLSDPTLSVLDPTGTVTTTVGGLDVEYELDVDSKGRITGPATADLDDNGSFETSGEVKGKLSGKAGEVKQSVKVSLADDALAAKLKLATKEVLSIPMDAVTGTQKASGKIGDLKIKEETSTDASPLPVPPQSWRLDFTLDGSDAVVDPVLSLEGGRVFPLEGSNKFDLVRDLTSLKLQSADKGIKIQLKKSAVDGDAVDPVTGGDLSYAILGQKGKVSLP